jgi:hypothetical protein
LKLSTANSSRSPYGAETNVHYSLFPPILLKMSWRFLYTSKDNSDERKKWRRWQIEGGSRKHAS